MAKTKINDNYLMLETVNNCAVLIHGFIYGVTEFTEMKLKQMKMYINLQRKRKQMVFNMQPKLAYAHFWN